MSEHQRMSIVDFCRRLFRFAEQEEKAVDAMSSEEREAWADKVCGKARPIEEVEGWLAETTGLKREDVEVFIHRAGNGGNWGPWRSTKGNWPDISPIAQRITEFGEARDNMDRLLAWFWQEYPEEARQLKLPTSACEKNARGKQARQGRRRVQQRRPTEAQLEALKVVGESGQNFAEAARRLKKDPKTVRQNYNAGLRNAGRLTSKLIGKPQTQSLPTDNRGQVDVQPGTTGHRVATAEEVSRPAKRRKNPG
jgi:hypothetical protein